jgi:hypothetical protein
MIRRAWLLVAAGAMALIIAGHVSHAAVHTLTAHFETVWDDECDVSWGDPSHSLRLRPGAGKVVAQSVQIGGPGPIVAVIRNTGGKPVEFMGNWSIRARCVVSLDGRQLGNQLISGYYGRNQAWSWSWPIASTTNPPAVASKPPSPPPTQGPQNFTVTSKFQAALFNMAMRFLGSGDSLTSADPLANVTPLTSSAPFTMPIGNNLVGNAGSGLTGSTGGAAFATQAIGPLQQTFQGVYGRQPTRDELVASAKLAMIMEGYVEAFGRAPQSGELQYWARQPNLTLSGLLGANSNWLRQNRDERINTIRRAFSAASARVHIGHAPNPTELRIWDARVARSGTLYADVGGRPGLVTQVAAALRPVAQPQPVPGRQPQPTPVTVQPVSKEAMIAQAYVEAFGRQPQPAEVQYWSRIPNLTLSGLLGANSNWLRTNTREREATVRRAFQAASARVGLRHTPSQAELSAWDAKVARSGTLYADVDGRPGLVTQLANALRPRRRGMAAQP